MTDKPAEEPFAPHIVTPPPGPLSLEHMARQAKVTWAGAIDTMPLAAARKSGSVIEDLDGNLLVDMVTGWGSTNVGAAHPDVIEPAVDTLRQFGHEISDYISTVPTLQLAEKLVEMAPTPLSRVAFEVTGTESVESAMKFMRAKTNRPFILTFLGQYHGESYGAQGVGAESSDYAKHMRELTNGFVHVPFPHPYRCPFHKRDPQECDGVCVIDYVRDFVLPHLVGADRIAGVMIEPIAGEAGVWIPPDPFWPALVDLCNENGWLLCADEVQTGFGRTGPMFAVEHWGIEPDLMCLAKGLSGGALPIAATLGSEDVMAASEVFVGGTFAWQPAACVGALKGIEVMERDNILDHGRRLEQLTLETVGTLPDRHESVGDVRIKGLYIGVEFVKDRETKEKDPETARAVHFACLARGVVDIYDEGTNFLRWQPALTMPEDMLLRAAEILDAAVAEVAGRSR